MASQEYYNSSPYRAPPRRLNAPLPPVPSSSETELKPKESSTVAVSPISSSLHDEDTYSSRGYQTDYFNDGRRAGYVQDPFSDDAAIPLQQQYPKHEQQPYYPQQPQFQHPQYNDVEQHRRSKKKKKRRRFTKNSPWFIYILTLVQIIVFIVEIAKNAILTGSPIETSPQFNPMIGPSPYVLINMGARYVPCMRNQAGVQNSSVTITWPCPDQTDDNPTCTLSELCGFGGVPLPKVNGSLDDSPAPNQWFRFIVPIFLHAGLIHIGFNMLLQVLMGGDKEKAIGPVRLAVVYFSSGIFGFVLGGNFAPGGIASTGASGSIFGIIALSLLDLLYTWPQRKRPVRDLCFIILDVVISFVLGLLPGLDNFSHIGGFLMGLVLGVCLLRSPTKLRQRIGSLDDPNTSSHRRNPRDSTVNLVSDDDDAEAHKRKAVISSPSSTRAFSSPRTFFGNRKPLWWAWWLIRAGALIGVIAAFIALVKAFYQYHDTECGWCKYLSCLPIDNWCDIGNLQFTQQGSSGS